MPKDMILRYGNEDRTPIRIVIDKSKNKRNARYRTRTAGQCVVFEVEGARERRIVEQLHLLILTSGAIRGCTKLIYGFHPNEFNISFVQPEISADKRINLGVDNLPDIVPMYLEDALNRTYSSDVRNLSAKDYVSDFHLINHPQTKQPIGVFDIELRRALLVNGYEYVIDILKRSYDKPKD